MADLRFSWSREGKDSCVIELKRRDIKRTLYKDSDLLCLACGKRPRSGEAVYYPTEFPNSTNNKIIGHQDCVDRRYAELVAKDTGERTKAALSRTHVPVLPVEAAAVARTGTRAAKPTKTISGSKRAKRNGAIKLVDGLGAVPAGYLQGWRDGVMFAFEPGWQPSAKRDPEWLAGFQEGLSFAVNHKSAS